METICQRLFERANDLPNGKLWVGLGGVPGAGKSTAAEQIVAELNKKHQNKCKSDEEIAVIFPMDGYHLRRSVLREQEDSEMLFKRRGAPFTFDPEKLLAKIQEIKENNEGKVPAFNHGVGDPEENAIEIKKCHRIVILEGLYVLLGEGLWKSITLEMSLCIFIECPLNLCKKRLIKRHCEKWNITKEAAEERAESNDLINARHILNHLMSDYISFTIPPNEWMDTNYNVGKLYVKDCSLISELVDGSTIYKAVKMSPFTIQLALDTSTLYYSHNPTEIAPPSSHLLTLANVNIDATLIFDHPEEKEVAYVKDKPLTYKVSINETGLEATFEIKLKVLSSQLEDMNFRVKFRALDAIHGQEICQHMITASEPIKIISKPEKANKRPRASGKKPTSNDTILESLERISAGLKENLDDMKDIYMKLNPGGPLPVPSSNVLPPDSSTFSLKYQAEHPSAETFMDDTPSFLSSLSTAQPPTKKQKIEDDRPLDFETSFKDMMKAFESLAAESRSFQMDKFVRTHRISVTELSELHDMLSDGGLGQPIGNPYSQNPMYGANQECNCEHCPFRKEVESRNEFMDSLFSINYN